MCVQCDSINRNGQQIPVEEKNEKVGSRDDPAAVLKGVLVKDGLVARNKNLLSLNKRDLLDGVRNPDEGSKG